MAGRLGYVARALACCHFPLPAANDDHGITASSEEDCSLPRLSAEKTLTGEVPLISSQG